MITVDKLYQWDLNRTVTVNDAADEMHWQQPYSSTALRTSIVDGKANIPNIVLQQHGKIKCWSYDSANGRTVNVYEIDISRRQKPDNYVYTETEAKTVEQYVYDYLANGQVQFSWNNITDKPSLYSKEEVDANKQDKLISGTNIKTINGQSILGEGNINIVPPETITALEQAKAIASQYQPNIYFEPQEDNEYDIVLFAGQSNMCGRAELSDFVNPEDVMLPVPSTMAITFNNTESTPVQIVEPISANGSSGYGLVPAFINAYYYTSKRKVCTCYQSVDGAMLNKFLPYTINFETNYENWDTPTTYYANMRNYINNYKTKLESIGKTVGRIFMVWLQGESDADYLGTDSTYCTNYEKTLTTDEQKTEYYCTKFKDMVNKLSEDTGLEHCFIIRIGHRGGATNVEYNSIIQAQNLLGRTYDKCTLVSAFFAGAKVFIEEDGTVRNLMRDSWHYVPEGYVRAGYEAGVNAAHCVSSNYAYNPILVEYNQVFLDTIAPADSLGIERKVDKYLYHPRIFDMRTAQRIVSESVASVTVAPTSMTLEVGQTVQLEVTVYPASATNKDVTYQSSNTNILTVSETGLVTAVAGGSATITVRSVENTNATATFSGAVLSLNAMTWAEISDISAAGTAANYFDVGDCKEVTLSDTVGTLSLNTTLFVYILGFDHNSTYEGNGITFGGFINAEKNLCLVDSHYNSTSADGSKRFNMSHWGAVNYGGWAGCDMRYDILGSTDVAPSGYGAAPTTSRVGYDATSTCATSPVANTLMSCLPSDLRAVMKPMTKYTDNASGGSHNTEANVTASVDYLPLLAEYEIFGARSLANEHEYKKQAQYAYYVAGNSKVKYKHSSTGSTARWWERSPHYAISSYFCAVHDNGNANSNTAWVAYGVAPAFLI
jgi:uncharacterized protein YjdB